MILLDTNVLSELMRATPSSAVVTWVANQPASGLYVSTVTMAEIFYGIRLLPAGRRRRAIESAAGELFDVDFAGRVLPFDGDAARSYAEIAAERRGAGMPISQFDAQIAGIARSRGATLATRNVSDFDQAGVDVVDPWVSARTK